MLKSYVKTLSFDVITSSFLFHSITGFGLPAIPKLILRGSPDRTFISRVPNRDDRSTLQNKNYKTYE